MTVVGVVLAATALVVLVPELPLATRSPLLDAALDTVAACIALLAWLLAFGRYRRRGHGCDLLLAMSFLLFALANTLFSAVPTILASTYASIEVWGALVIRGLAAAAFCASALVPPRRWGRRHAAAASSAAALAVALAVGAAGWALRGRLPEGVNEVLPEPASVLWSLEAHPLLAAAQAVGLALFAVAAVGYWRRSRSGDTFASWLAAAAVFAAGARLHYLAYPSLYADTVYSGDYLRLGFYLLVLAGAVREVFGYWEELAVTAVAGERRRVARDLHDGVMQELAFLASELGQIQQCGPEKCERLASVAKRALDESRRAIEGLRQERDGPLAAAVVSAAEQVAGRYGVEVGFQLDVGVPDESEHREHLLRIVREGVVNAARHGCPDQITVALSRTGNGAGGLVLEITDDGRGFEPDKVAGRGFGLVSMRERAAALGGQVEIDSRPGKGTKVRLTLP